MNSSELQSMAIDISPEVKESFRHWHKFMTENVCFWLKDSEIHTKRHCSRVLLYSLMIAKQMNLSTEEQEKLAVAACFHDSRRLNDGRDKGHGQRAADYYRAFCENNLLDFDKQIYYIIAYHDQSDESSLIVIQNYLADYTNTVLLYQIFKDADALDRFRLGANGLNIQYLRTREALQMVEFAKDLVQRDWQSF